MADSAMTPTEALLTRHLENTSIEVRERGEIIPVGINAIPVGVYVVKEDGSFLFCNEEARKLLKLPLTGDIKQSIQDFYSDRNDRQGILKQVEEKEKEGEIVRGKVVCFTIEGKPAWVKISCRRITGEKGGICYVGSIEDFTEEHQEQTQKKELQEKVDSLIFDIGSVLHANTSTLFMVTQALDSSLDILQPNPFAKNGLQSSAEISEHLDPPARCAERALKKLLLNTSQELKRQTLPEKAWHTLEEILDLLQNYKQIPITEHQPPTLRDASKDALDILNAIPRHKFSRELIREVKNCFHELTRLTTLIEVIKAREAVIQVDFTLKAFREFVTSNKRSDEEREAIKVDTLLENATNHVNDFAHARRVTLKKNNHVGTTYVFGISRELERALGNILHNAIKYSWQRSRGTQPWIRIQVERSGKNIHIIVENWGVAISRREIEEEHIFKLGYRGKHSKDRGRLGTGIGLTDAREVAIRHNGNILVTSRPAHRYSTLTEADENYYKQPFITTVTLILPEYY